MALIPGQGRFEPVISVAPFAARRYADTLRCPSWFALQCDRGPAGLRAKEMARDPFFITIDARLGLNSDRSW